MLTIKYLGGVPPALRQAELPNLIIILMKLSLTYLYNSETVKGNVSFPIFKNQKHIQSIKKDVKCDKFLMKTLKRPRMVNVGSKLY